MAAGSLPRTAGAQAAARYQVHQMWRAELRQPHGSPGALGKLSSSNRLMLVPGAGRGNSPFPWRAVIHPCWRRQGHRPTPTAVKENSITREDRFREELGAEGFGLLRRDDASPRPVLDPAERQRIGAPDLAAAIIQLEGSDAPLARGDDGFRAVPSSSASTADEASTWEKPAGRSPKGK